MLDVTKPEPMPVGAGEDVGDAAAAFVTELGYPDLAQDLKARIEMGAKKYGTRLKSHNGRNTLMDIFQECADSIHYSMQYTMENPQDPDGISLLLKSVALAAAVKRKLNVQANG
jgi:hypothetical protein